MRTSFGLLLLSSLAIGACSLPSAPTANGGTCAPIGSPEYDRLNARQATLYLANNETVNAEQQAIIDRMCPESTRALYTCETKPRIYVLPDGTTQSETDHYSQSVPCPVSPID